MKRPTILLQTALAELGMQSGVSIERDSQVIENRVKHEGFSFLTITLPELDDLLLQGIENGRFPSQDCKSFRLNRERSLPLFLGGFFKRVFNMDGTLRDEPDSDCIFAIRQLVRLFKKLKLPCSGKRELSAIKGFINVEEGLYHADQSISREDQVLDQVAMQLWSSTFYDLCRDNLLPRHGPGATAERYQANARYRIRSWYSRIEESYPSDSFAIPNFGFADELRNIDYLDVLDELPVRVVFVPKTLKTPRVIAIEPSHMQYVQQSLLRYLVPVLESHPYTRNSIRFSDQSVNVARARSASINRRFCTMDLNEASDRVSLKLVQRIFARSNLLQFLEDGRSLSATLPNGDNILLKKYASMGSALCFPVEAMVFYTLIQACLHQYHHMVPCSQSICEFSKLIDIYGDDIVVPTGYMDIIIGYLESYGLKVNRRKTFSRSHFRESCGGDFFNGYSVKPVYTRSSIPESDDGWNPESTMSLAATANQFYQIGMWSTARVIRDWVEARWGTVPLAREEGDGLYFLSAFQRSVDRFGGAFQRFEQKRVVFLPKKKKDSIVEDGLAAFNRIWLPKPLEKSYGNGTHFADLPVDNPIDLVSSTKRGVFTPKRRWVMAT